MSLSLRRSLSSTLIWLKRATKIKYSQKACSKMSLSKLKMTSWKVIMKCGTWVKVKAFYRQNGSKSLRIQTMISSQFPISLTSPLWSFRNHINRDFHCMTLKQLRTPPWKLKNPQPPSPKKINKWYKAGFSGWLKLRSSRKMSQILTSTSEPLTFIP